MGTYSDYINLQLDFEGLSKERKVQLQRISQFRGRDVLVIAADISKPAAPIAIQYSDLLAVKDQISNLSGSAVDVILETPGGSAECAEDIVRLLRSKYSSVGIIVPGWAKSAGAIMAMSGDEILMDASSALGPIDAQIIGQGKAFSADALLEGLEKIKQEIQKTGILNKAYIPILQAISPGELQHAENALAFSKRLVTDWLAQYKFQDWKTHSSSGQPVTDSEKRTRAQQIAQELCDHRKWLTHNRSIHLSDLTAMRLRITDYSKEPELADAIQRYHTLMQMSFSSNLYKIFETPQSQIYRFFIQQAIGSPAASPNQAGMAMLEFVCVKCQTAIRVQANIGKPQPLQPGALPFPANNKFLCPGCGIEHDLSDARRQFELQSRKRVVT